VKGLTLDEIGARLAGTKIMGEAGTSEGRARITRRPVTVDKQAVSGSLHPSKLAWRSQATH
jgi:hypothetical protein